MSIINNLRFSEYKGMQICTIGNRKYRVAPFSSGKNVILFPIISEQDELLKEQAHSRLEQNILLSRHKNPNDLKSGYEPLWAAFERHALKS